MTDDNYGDGYIVADKYIQALHARVLHRTISFARYDCHE